MHCNIKHDPEHGWVIYENADKPSTSGTWIHPKPYNRAKYDISNSPPVVVYDGMVVKAVSYAFKFNFE